MVTIWKYDSPLGMMTMSSEEDSLTGLWFDGQRHYGNILSGNETEKLLPIFEKTAEWLDIYFSGKEPDFFPPVCVKGTPFRRRVCEIMRTIPYGKTMTYGEIAQILAREKGIERMAAQAVGNAVGYNPISIIIPCHRVLGANGNLTGYGGGIERKVRLLKLEKVDMSRFYIPKRGNAL